MLYGKSYLNIFTEKEYIEDTISLNGDDWTFSKHRVIDTQPKEEDFRVTIKDFLNWKMKIYSETGEKNA